MTGPEMNAPWRKKLARLLFVPLIGGMSACATVADAPADAPAPLSPRVEALIAENRGYPSWRDFPRPSEPVPPAEVIAARVQALDQQSETLAFQVAGIGWTLDDPEGFARDIAERVANRPLSPDTAMTRQEVEAFAASLRERGRAPPPMPRR